MFFGDMDFKPLSNAEAILEQLKRDTAFDLYPKEEPIDEDKQAFQEAYEWGIEKANHEMQTRMDHSAFLENVQEELLELGIYSAFVSPVLESFAANTREQDIACDSIKEFVQDKGVINLLEQFRYQNIHLANLAHVIDKEYDRIVEHCDNCIKEGLPEEEIHKIEDHDIHKFVLDCKSCCPKDITNKITQRVEDAVNDFIDDKKKSQFKLQQIYQKAKQKIQDYNNSQQTMGMPSQSDIPMGDGSMDPEVGVDNNFNAKMDAQQNEEIANMANPGMQPPPNAMKGSNVGLQTPAQEAMAWAKGQESMILESSYSVFDAMVRAVMGNIYKNSALQESYMDSNGKTDLKTVINDVRSMYTILEAFNVLGIIDLNEEYITNMLQEMQKVEF